MDYPITKWPLPKHQENIFYRTKELVELIGSNNFSTVKQLIADGADVTALNNQPVAGDLIRNNLAGCRDDDNVVPSAIAALIPFLDNQRLTQRRFDGKNLLMIAVERNYTAIVNALVLRFVVLGTIRENLQKHMTGNETAFTIAAKLGNVNALMNFLPWVSQDELNRHTCDDSTPLMYAAEKGHVGVAAILLQKLNVAAINYENLQGQKASLIALTQGHVNIFNMIKDRFEELEAESKVAAEQYNQQTPSNASVSMHTAAVGVPPAPVYLPARDGMGVQQEGGPNPGEEISKKIKTTIKVAFPS